MADINQIPANLEELITSHAKFDGAPDIPENTWLEVQFPNENGGMFNLLQIPQQGTLGLFTEGYNLQRLYYWRPGGEVQNLEPGNEYSLSVNPGDAIIWEYAEGGEAAFKMAWWFE